jgi:hypothetical protein
MQKGATHSKIVTLRRAGSDLKLATYSELAVQRTMVVVLCEMCVQEVARSGADPFLGSIFLVTLLETA